MIPPARLFVPLLVLTALLLSSGCSAVYVAKPVGIRPHALKPEQWNGVWLGGEDGGAVTVLVTDAANGRLEIGEIKTRDQKLVLETATAFVRESGDTLFINLRPVDASTERYLWARIKIADGQVAIWAPHEARLRARVRSGKLAGQAEEKGDVHLAELAAATVTEFAQPLSDAFDWETPLMLRRVGR